MDSSSVLKGTGDDDDGGERLKKELPEDLMVEIFARLPVKSLLRLRCVSKRWYSLILSPNFISTHSSHSHTRTVSLLCDSPTQSAGRLEKTIISFRLGDLIQRLTFHGHIECIGIVGCSNGVVCLSLSPHSSLQKYVLWNPATRQLKSIDTYRKGAWYGSGFRFDPATNAFKVTLLVLTDDTAERKTRAHILVYSTDTNSWTRKNIVVPYRIQLNLLGTVPVRMCVNEYMHWLVTVNKNNSTRLLHDLYTLSYNMIDEVFQRIEMPIRINPLISNCRLASYKGSLAVIVHRPSDSDRSYTDVDVWVMNDFDGFNHSWSKILTCRPSIRVNSAIGFVRKDDVYLVLLCKDPDCTLYVYNPLNGDTKWFWKTVSIPEALLYEDSLVSLY